MAEYIVQVVSCTSVARWFPLMVPQLGVFPPPTSTRQPGHHIRQFRPENPREHVWRHCVRKISDRDIVFLCPGSTLACTSMALGQRSFSPNFDLLRINFTKSYCCNRGPAKCETACCSLFNSCVTCLRYYNSHTLFWWHYPFNHVLYVSGDVTFYIENKYE
jgi:hypothetical protein